MAQSHGWDFPIIIDEGKKLSSRYGVFGLPTVIVYERGGKMKKKIFGFNPRIVEIIEKALGIE